MVSAASARGALAAAALVAFAAGAAAQGKGAPGLGAGLGMAQFTEGSGPILPFQDLVVWLLNTTGLGERAIASFA